MQIKRIELTNFRNHPHLVIDDIGRVLIIVGCNAVGKTNIIEALQLLSMHESFRGAKPEEFINKEEKEKDSAQICIDIEILNTINSKQINYTSSSRTYYYNQKERPSKELLDLLPAVLFTPDDLQIVKGSPERRRDVLDSLGSRLSKTFAQIKSEYNKALRHKNSLLKQEEVERGLLDSWNINLAKLGMSLSKHRIGLFEQLLEVAASSYLKISGGEELTGSYIISWNTIDERKEDDLYTVLEHIREKEVAAARSLAGPHRDDIQFTINTNDARRFASQGQQRSIALALKIAEIEILRRVSGKNPLLLLDDVMSELDTERRRYFLELIEEAGQTVITTTNLGYFDEGFLENATVVELKGKNSKQRSLL